MSLDLERIYRKKGEFNRNFDEKRIGIQRFCKLTGGCVALCLYVSLKLGLRFKVLFNQDFFSFGY